MPVSRDRLSRPIDISTLLGNAERRVNLLVDEPGLRWRGLGAQNVSTGQGAGSGIRPGRCSIRARRRRYRHRQLYRSPVDQENRTPMTTRSGQGRNSILPPWYPRSPLRDITTIVRAIERRRAELHADEQTEAPQQETNTQTANIQIEHDLSVSTPMATIPVKPQPSPAPQVCKIVDSIVDENANDVNFITPQKKLLNSIDKVRQIWLEDQRKLERTPAAKKAERERKVRTLMSMR